MSTENPIQLSPQAIFTLEALLSSYSGHAHLLTSAIRRKLACAEIRFPDDLDADVVTLGSRVLFTIDDSLPHDRRLVREDQYVPGQGHQTIASLRGIAMLGLRSGMRAEIDCGNRIETIDILDVPFQPESMGNQSRQHLRLVSDRAVSPAPSIWRRSGDDPGPSAA